MIENSKYPNIPEGLISDTIYSLQTQSLDQKPLKAPENYNFLQPSNHMRDINPN